MNTALPASPRRRAPYRIRGERVWACIRARYLAGESAPALAAEFDVSVYAIRRRITREGWSKRGLAAAEDAAEVNDCRHPSACAARPEDPAAGASPTLSRTPTVDTGWADRSPAAPLGPPVGAADAAGRRMTTGEAPPLEPRVPAPAPPGLESNGEPPKQVATDDTNIRDLKVMPGNPDIGPQALDSLHPVFPESNSPVGSPRPSTATRSPTPCQQGGDV